MYIFLCFLLNFEHWLFSILQNVTLKELHLQVYEVAFYSDLTLIIMCSKKRSHYTYGVHISPEPTIEKPGHWSCNSSGATEAISSLGLLILKIKEEWKEQNQNYPARQNDKFLKGNGQKRLASSSDFHPRF